jgi:hypothetical protein
LRVSCTVPLRKPSSLSRKFPVNESDVRL